MTCTILLPRLVVEYRKTRDAQVPISHDDPEMQCGWQNVPIAPTADPGWAICDTRHDYKTTWRRFRIAWSAVS